MSVPRSCSSRATSRLLTWLTSMNSSNAPAMRRPIVNNSERGDLIYEPFCGSGTTLIAAETVGRRCFALELDPAYCDVIVKRWQEFTGQAAVLDGGPTFDELAAHAAGLSQPAIR